MRKTVATFPFKVKIIKRFWIRGLWFILLSHSLRSPIIVGYSMVQSNGCDMIFFACEVAAQFRCIYPTVTAKYHLFSGNCLKVVAVPTPLSHNYTKLEALLSMTLVLTSESG